MNHETMTLKEAQAVLEKIYAAAKADRDFLSENKSLDPRRQEDLDRFDGNKKRSLSVRWVETMICPFIPLEKYDILTPEEEMACNVLKEHALARGIVVSDLDFVVNTSFWQQGIGLQFQVYADKRHAILLKECKLSEGALKAYCYKLFNNILNHSFKEYYKNGAIFEIYVDITGQMHPLMLNPEKWSVGDVVAVYVNLATKVKNKLVKINTPDAKEYLDEIESKIAPALKLCCINAKAIAKAK